MDLEKIISVCHFSLTYLKHLTVSHSILLEKLEHYGIRDNALNGFKSYLLARMQYVQTGDMLSSREVDIGVLKAVSLGLSYSWFW